MVSDKKLANAVGGKTARACDNCIRKRARWYCAADDAFLCQVCDATVHSANPLALRHERVRLKTASTVSSRHREEKLPPPTTTLEAPVPRKARTPRKSKPAGEEEEKKKKKARNPLHHLVPEVCSDDTTTSGHEGNEEQLLYRVPIFDPFVAELCNSSGNSNEAPNSNNDINKSNDQSNRNMIFDCTHNLFHGGSAPSELDLAEFAADVESLLGTGLDDESSFDMEGLGLMDMDCSFGRGEVKVEEEEDEEIADDEEAMNMAHHCHQVDNTREPFQFNFHDSSSLGAYEEEIKTEAQRGFEDFGENYLEKNKKEKILLRLDYESVITAWDDQKSPWTNGEGPEMDCNDQCWPYCMGSCGRIHHYGGVAGHNNPTVDINNNNGAGREARVTRYREKRRTRLFSKKIRYEVRKLNAEKRPRMKGRFVKRSVK